MTFKFFGDSSLLICNCVSNELHSVIGLIACSDKIVNLAVIVQVKVGAGGMVCVCCCFSADQKALQLHPLSYHR